MKHFIIYGVKCHLGLLFFKKSLFKKGYYNKFIGTSHPYSGFIWEAISLIETPRIYCGTKPVVEFNDVKRTYLKDEFKIKYYEIPLWFNLLRSSYIIINDRMIFNNYLIFMSSFNRLLYHRANDKFYLKNVQNYMSFFSHGASTKSIFIKVHSKIYC